MQTPASRIYSPNWTRYVATPEVTVNIAHFPCQEGVPARPSGHSVEFYILVNTQGHRQVGIPAPVGTLEHQNEAGWLIGTDGYNYLRDRTFLPESSVVAWKRHEFKNSMARDGIIREFAEVSQRVIIRSNRYGSTLSYFNELLTVAEADFGTLDPTQVEVVHYGGDRYKRTFGLEFNVAKDTFIPEHYGRQLYPEYKL